MASLIDTNIAIHLRDGDADVIARLAELDAAPLLSLISLVELKGGVVARSATSERRHERLAALLDEVEIVGFDQAVVEAYGQITARLGFSRSRILDRLIAATAIVNDLTLVTINAADFQDIPDLKLEVWPAHTA